MQSSQRIATAMPSAVNSLVLTSSAFGVSAACARPVKAFIASGASPRNVRMTPLILLVWFCQSVMGRFSSTNIHDAEYDFGSRDIDADQKQTVRLFPCRPFRPQQEQKQRAPGHLILLPEGQAHRRRGALLPRRKGGRPVPPGSPSSPGGFLPGSRSQPRPPTTSGNLKTTTS